MHICRSRVSPIGSDDDAVRLLKKQCGNQTIKPFMSGSRHKAFRRVRQ